MDLIMSYNILNQKDIERIKNSENILIELIKLTEKYSNLFDMIREYCKTYPNEVNKRDDKEYLPLYVATTVHADDICKLVQILIEYGANINMVVGFSTPLSNSVWCNNIELANLLLTNGAIINVYEHKYMKLLSKSFKMAKLLLEYDASERYINVSEHQKIISNILLINTKA